MGIFKEIPPTAGFPLLTKDLLALFSSTDGQNCLENDFRQYLNVPYARVVYSGTAALYLIIETIKSLSEKRTVIIPSFVCPLIPIAIRRAGLKIEICDINRDNFSFDAKMLETLCEENKDVLAIVTVHLAGLPVDLEAVVNIAKKYSVFTIEDCAQSLGASYRGSKVGTWGDFSFFSLGRGKGATTYQGGIITTSKKEFSDILDKNIKRMVKRNIPSEGVLIAKLFGYAIFYRPLLFWHVFRLPQLFWNSMGDKTKAAMEYFDINFPVHSVSTARQVIGHSQFLRVDKEMQKQRSKAHSYIKMLHGIEGLKVICESSDCIALYPFVTVVLDDAQRRERALRVLEKSGDGGSFVYAFAIADYNYLKDFVPDRNCSNARYLSERTVTLSTSTFLEDNDLRSAAALLINP